MSQVKRRRYGVRMPPEEKDFSVLKIFKTGSGLTQIPAEWVQDSFHGSNAARA